MDEKTNELTKENMANLADGQVAAQDATQSGASQPVQPKTIDDLAKEIEALRKEAYVNRILIVVAMLLAVGYMSWEIRCLKEILSTLLEMFLAG